MNFYKAKILALFQVKSQSGINLVLIANGEKLKSSVVVVNHELHRLTLPELNGVKITRLADDLYAGHLFGIDASQNLIATNVDLLCKGVTPYKIFNFAKHSASATETTLAIDEEYIWLLHESGTVQKIQSFAGKIQLESFGGEESYLVWKQKNHLFAAVDKYNVVSFWNTITGNLIFMKMLAPED